MKQTPEGYYAVIFYENESKTYGVRFPNHSGIVTFGKTYNDALKMANEALSNCLKSKFDRDHPLPASSKPKLKKGDKLIYVKLEPEIRTAYMLRRWREKEGLSQKQLAARLGTSFQAYQRMERPGKSNVTVSTLQKIAHALNKRLILDIQNFKTA